MISSAVTLHSRTRKFFQLHTFDGGVVRIVALAACRAA